MRAKRAASRKSANGSEFIRTEELASLDKGFAIQAATTGPPEKMKGWSRIGEGFLRIGHSARSMPASKQPSP